MPQRLATVVKIGSLPTAIGGLIPEGSPRHSEGECAALLLNPADIVVIDATTPEEAIGQEERVFGSLLV